MRVSVNDLAAMNPTIRLHVGGREVLESLISAAEFIEDRCTKYAEILEVRAEAEHARNIVARISALLPPRPERCGDGGAGI